MKKYRLTHTKENELGEPISNMLKNITQELIKISDPQAIILCGSLSFREYIQDPLKKSLKSDIDIIMVQGLFLNKKTVSRLRTYVGSLDYKIHLKIKYIPLLVFGIQMKTEGILLYSKNKIFKKLWYKPFRKNRQILFNDIVNLILSLPNEITQNKIYNIKKLIPLSACILTTSNITYNYKKNFEILSKNKVLPDQYLESMKKIIDDRNNKKVILLKKDWRNYFSTLNIIIKKLFKKRDSFDFSFTMKKNMMLNIHLNKIKLEHIITNGDIFLTDKLCLSYYFSEYKLFKEKKSHKRYEHYKKKIDKKRKGFKKIRYKEIFKI